MTASMTGFSENSGIETSKAETVRWRWEMRSVNNRGLDVRLRLPQGMERFDAPSRKSISAAFARGSISANLTVERSGAAPELTINRVVLEQTLAAARVVKEADPDATLSADGILSLRGVLEVADQKSDDDEALDKAIQSGLAEAIKGLAAARAEEGARIASVLSALVDDIAKLTAEAEANPSRSPEAIRARLAEQVNSLMDASNALEPARLHQEAAILASKADIREELDRLHAHVEAARDLLAADGPVGRKLDFLTQEFNR